MTFKQRFHIMRDRSPSFVQFFIFCIIGTLNTLTDFTFYYLLTRALHIYFIAANIISFALVSIMSFFLNKRWTFRDQGPKVHIQYMKFLTVVTFGLLLNTGLLYIFVRWLHIPDLIAKALAVGIVLFWNFGMNKLWTFSKFSHQRHSSVC
ncbi:MAG: hypothetical protein A3B74_00040 [Candidatus Kerfeldbacteria bacterium RIFCSPHIGHO2_02_FULL_42_14]|uniref:GtrA/DPMS transmembrane domain-containing protein n=1 Tax=Candidatus Kerfeldbacteria bacterium RIFCSPHIGHO2_02_FULL_42_14 TaxID=1798540 RepID=A0A1G2AQQ3_9BACT|nr:MAG: hypothetical protein A3B74_00040 [Candidatus Kerfeldbacteria bacterium RIFCSPHIGHO2_02_FULL_42_14]OGY83607.1 MAG: hypothetical protein A3I91_03130 [Candidatus Kerfeldbacteria bacterium RIFCSPLOWO2_02_FULL_42_19]OGY86679.1 MAG: hypothetical protein A3G01_00495 [Candidatus Kerfeldbacteria bacterium RIFCSPLOWO2_12_FULL_43_9]